MARFEIPAGWVAQAYRFALDPTPTQQRALRSHAGAARFAHNHMLALVKAVMDQRTAERSYGISDDELTPSLGWSLPTLRKTWNTRKAAVAPWWGENSKEAYNTGLDALARGLDNWSKSRTGQRAGKPVGFPRFKTAWSRRSVRFTTGVIRPTSSLSGEDRRLARDGCLMKSTLTLQKATVPAEQAHAAGLDMLGFEVAATHDLTRHAALFGLSAALDRNRGHFPGLSPAPLAVEAAGQNVVARFDATGFEAAAVSAVAMAPGGVPQKSWSTITSVRIDRPFGFVAVDRPTGLAIVAGQVTRPPLEWVRPASAEPSPGRFPGAPW
ncbi:helix-turn-helix domain-containing protein [Nocardia sp. NPDC058497]|uniref:helix-turn-helix domain-containing protein n=1 Tax=Nocardia sp. NPDC058497 TaxID=3346529 RepID=UPI00365A2991